MKKLSIFLPDGTPRLDRLTARDAENLARYLESATAVMHTHKRIADCFSHSPLAVVPLTVRTDGVYVWNGTVPYYVRKYFISPDREFVEFARSLGFEPDEPSHEQISAALATFTVP